MFSLCDPLKSYSFQFVVAHKHRSAMDPYSRDIIFIYRNIMKILKRLTYSSSFIQALRVC